MRDDQSTPAATDGADAPVTPGSSEAIGLHDVPLAHGPEPTDAGDWEAEPANLATAADTQPLQLPDFGANGGGPSDDHGDVALDAALNEHLDDAIGPDS